MYAAIKLDVGVVPFEGLEKVFGGTGVEAFDKLVDSYIREQIQGYTMHPPTQFYYEPRKKRAIIQVLTNMPEGIAAGEVIRRMSDRYIEDNIDYVEKVTLLNLSYIAKNPPKEVLDKYQVPSEMPEQYRLDSLVIVSQLRDDTESTFEIRVLNEDKTQYVRDPEIDSAVNDRGAQEDGSVNRFENLFEKIPNKSPESEFTDRHKTTLVLTEEEKKLVNVEKLHELVTHLLDVGFNVPFNSNVEFRNNNVTDYDKKD